MILFNIVTDHYNCKREQVFVDSESTIIQLSHLNIRKGKYLFSLAIVKSKFNIAHYVGRNINYLFRFNQLSSAEPLRCQY